MSKNSWTGTQGLNPNQGRQNVGPDPGTNCLGRLQKLPLARKELFIYCLRPNKKIQVFRVTRPYINLQVKPQKKIQVFWKNYNFMHIESKIDDKDQKRYTQVPHLIQDTIWESNKNTINFTNKSQEVSPFPAGDHKAAMSRRECMRNTRHKNTNDPQKKYRLRAVS